MKKIIEVLKTGVKYQDENAEKFIKFDECNKNWVNYKKRRTGKDTINNLLYVGQKDSTSSPMYIELFIRPFIRFEFNDREDYNQVRDEINKNGWNLLDLS